MRTRGVGGRRVHFQVGDEDVVKTPQRMVLILDNKKTQFH